MTGMSKPAGEGLAAHERVLPGRLDARRTEWNAMIAKLPTATLGNTNLNVTRLGYGAMEVRGAPRGRDVTDDQARTILNAVLDSGISYIDTANDYGRSEEHIGRFLGARRHEYTLATKCGCVPGGGAHVWTRENLFRGLEESLQRLKTDYVDVMQLHNPTVEQAEANDVVASLEAMRAEGKVRWIGISTTQPHLSTYLDWGSFDVFQIPYSAVLREHEAWIGKAAEAGIGTVIRGGVGKGEPGVGLATEERWAPYRAAKLDDLRDPEESPTAFMLRFTLSHPGIQTIITGTVNPDHLAENVAAARRGPLPADTYAEAKRRLSGAGQEPGSAP